MSFLIRPAQSQDTPLILEFIKELAEYEKLSHEVVADEATLKESFFGPPNAPKCLLAFEDQTPVGFCIYFYNFSSFVGKQGIYLEDLFVKPEFRGRSYGKKLLLELVKIAKEEGLGRVEWSVLDWNTPAIEFYKSLGAKDMNEWTVYRLSREAIENLV
jgi:ribosomal protein S18 acetylase RimI-like enzyme